VDQDVELDRSQVAAMYIVTVTPLGLQMFATRIANQDAALQISGAGEYPWAVSLGDLRYPHRYPRFANDVLALHGAARAHRTDTVHASRG
jgi:hypothetical protein